MPSKRDHSIKSMIIEELSNRANVIECSRVSYSQWSYHKGIAPLYQTILWPLHIKRAYLSRMKTWPHILLIPVIEDTIHGGVPYSYGRSRHEMPWTKIKAILIAFRFDPIPPRWCRVCIYPNQSMNPNPFLFHSATRVKSRLDPMQPIPFIGIF